MLVGTERIIIMKTNALITPGFFFFFCHCPFTDVHNDQFVSPDFLFYFQQYDHAKLLKYITKNERGLLHNLVKFRIYFI